MSNPQKICVLGDGAWGTAVAMLLADNGHQVTLWCHNADVAHSITTLRRNDRFLPDIKLPDSIIATTDIQLALLGASIIFEAVPVKFLRSVIESARPYVLRDHLWIVLSKGIEHTTLLLPTQIIDDAVGYKTRTVVVSGPSFAHDLVRKHITAVTIASEDSSLADAVHTLMKNSYFCPERSSDPLGVQMCGAVKNVIALAVGMLDGAGSGDNTKAFILSRGLQEMKMLINAVGGNEDTAHGLAGVGDLVLTCMGKYSRNVEVGRELGRGKTVAELSAARGTMPEGINTVVSIHQLMQRHNLSLPLCNGVYQVLAHGSPLKTMLNDVVCQVS